MRFMALGKRVCVIFGAGPFGMPDFDLRGHLGETPYIICADGGLDNARRADFSPDMVIGDFDSAEGGLDGLPSIRLNAEKDYTDLKVCADYGLQKGYDTFFLFCCTGGRLDHFFANAFLLEALHKKGARGYILDAANIIAFAEGPGRVEFETVEGYKFLSVVPIDPCSGLTLEGVKYPLTGASITRDDAIWVSNEPIADKISIGLERGKIFIILSK